MVLRVNLREVDEMPPIEAYGPYEGDERAIEEKQWPTEGIEPSAKIPISHWSHSSLMSYLRNPLAWYKRYVERVYDMPSSPAGIIGRAGHVALQHFYGGIAKEGAAMLNEPKVLLISSDETEASTWEEILRDHAMLKSVRSLPELEKSLESDVYDAVFCGWSFHLGTWQDTLQQVRQRCPDVPVVIFCRAGSEREWLKVLEAGAFDLLAAPYQQRTALYVLEQAVASYEERRLHNGAQYAMAKAS